MIGSKVNMQIKKYSWPLACVLAFFSVWGLERYGLRLRADYLGVANSVVSLLFVAFAVLIFHRALQHLSKRLLVYSAVGGFMFSTMLVLGAEIYYDDCVRLGDWKKWIAVLLTALLFGAITAIVLEAFPQIQQRIHNTDLRLFHRERMNGDRKYFLIVWAIIFLAYVPAWLASFPGIYGYDSIYQTHMIYFEDTINAKHPILHTLYLCGSLELGELLFGTKAAGMALYSLSQMLMMSAAFAYVCAFLARRKVHPLLQLTVIAYFALWPIHAIYSVSSTKDVLFAALILLSVVFTVDMVQDQAGFFASKFRIIRYVVTLFLMMNFRNNGFYMMIVITPFMIILMRRYWKKMLAICLAALISYMAFTGPLFSALGIEPGDKREALCTPIQQIARAVNYNRDEITDEEYAKICEVIPEERLDDYISRTADPVKNYFQTDTFMQDPIGYVKVWASIGLKCPGTYLDAMLCTTFGFWYPDMAYPDPPAWHPYIEFKNTPKLLENQIMIGTHTLSQPLLEFYQDIAYNTVHQKLPAISMIFSPGFAFWMLLLLMLIMLYYKKRQFILAPLLLFLLWGTLFLSPVVLIRYAYPIMISMPVLYALFASQQWCVSKGKCPDSCQK